MKGYFKAPVSGEHKFYISGDDLAEFWLYFLIKYFLNF